jgi:hypothetical protein
MNMKKSTIGAVSAAVLAITGFAASGAWPGANRTGSAPERVARGQYLVNMMGCNDCHTPLKMGAQGPEPDVSRFLSGHPEQIGPLRSAALQPQWMWAGSTTNTAYSGPWGVSYTANLTPDQNTGLGIWTEEMFVNAIRLGKHMGVSRPIMPPMPWPAFRNASDDDLKAIYAYLRTIKPITNHVPDYEPPPAGPAAH